MREEERGKKREMGLVINTFSFLFVFLSYPFVFSIDSFLCVHA